jgi:Putative 2OG-Fe(II) oxygenase
MRVVGRLDRSCMTSTMKTQRNVVVRGLFATLLAALEVPDGQKRETDLVARVVRRRSKTPAVQASNAVGWRSDREMLDLRGAGPDKYGQALQFVGEDGGSVAAPETIRTRPGLALMFLSSLLHQVRPYRGSALRISIAFNRSL